MEWMAHDGAHGRGNGMASPEGQGVDHAEAGVGNVVAAPQQVVVDHPIVEAVVVEEGAVVGHLASHHMPSRENKLCEATRGQKGNSSQLSGNWKLRICFDFSSNEMMKAGDTIDNTKSMMRWEWRQC